MATEPIQDSELTCPWCGYNMTALTSNRCPECGNRFVLSKPGAAVKARPFTLTGSMICQQCGRDNTSFMPDKCEFCGHPFKWWERVFGTRRR